MSIISYEPAFFFPPPWQNLATQKEKATMTTVELKPISKQSEDTLGMQVDKKTPSQKGKLCIAVHYMKQACTLAHWVSGVFSPGMFSPGLTKQWLHHF